MQWNSTDRSEHDVGIPLHFSIMEDDSDDAPHAGASHHAGWS